MLVRKKVVFVTLALFIYFAIDLFLSLLSKLEVFIQMPESAKIPIRTFSIFFVFLDGFIFCSVIVFVITSLIAKRWKRASAYIIGILIYTWINGMTHIIFLRVSEKNLGKFAKSTSTLIDKLEQYKIEKEHYPQMLSEVSLANESPESSYVSSIIYVSDGKEYELSKILFRPMFEGVQYRFVSSAREWQLIGYEGKVLKRMREIGN